MRRIIAALAACVLILLLCGCGTPAAPETLPTPTPAPAFEPRTLRYTPESAALVRELIDGYPDGDAAATRERLGRLAALDAGIGALWTDIVDYWDFVNTDLAVNEGALPDGLPEDDSLCLVVLGYQLRPDGGMEEELVRRCETALAGAEKYPAAYVLVTGGATALLGSATEAGRMADWLAEHGVARERLIVEDGARTSAENASRSAAILRERFPQVKSLAIVSSDYHIALGSLLFYAQARKEAYETGAAPFAVVSNAGCPVPGKAGTQGPAMQALFLRSLMRPEV